MKLQKREAKKEVFRLSSLPFFYGWIIVAVAGLTHFSSAPGQTYVVSIFLDSMIQELDWTRTLFSGMYTAGSLAAAAFMILVGKVLDKFGSRKTLVVLCILMGLTCIWMSDLNTPWQLLFGFAALRAIGQGSFSLVASTMTAIWFVRKRGRATALASLGMATSMGIFPIVVHYLIGQFEWRDAWTILGVSVWAILLIPSLLLVRRSPEDVGLVPDGEPDLTNQVENYNRDNYITKNYESNYTLSEAWKTRSLWMLTLSSISSPLIMTGLMFHHVSILGSKGISPAVAAATLGLFGPLMLVSGLIAGILVDRFPGRFLLAGGQILLIIAMLWVFIIDSPWKALVYVTISACAIGLVNTTGTVIWANYFGRAHIGSIKGFSTTTMVAFSALGALPFGFIYDWTDSYNIALSALLLLPLTSLVFTLMALPPGRKDKERNHF